MKEKGPSIAASCQARVSLGWDGNPKLETEDQYWDFSKQRIERVRKRFTWFDYPPVDLIHTLLRELRKGASMNPNVPPFGAIDFQRGVDVFTDHIKLEDIWYEDEVHCDVPRR